MRKDSFGRALRLAVVVGIVALALPAAASAQATRTWVSGVGDDANPCSRTAPCKTFAGAISKTAAGGEMNCLDPGGFGGLTINKSLTLKCHNTLGGALVSGTNAFVINAAPTDQVTIRGLDINGVGTGAPTSLAGIKVISAGRVNLYDNDIYQFKAGVLVVPTGLNSETKVVMKRNHIHHNDLGVLNAPGNNNISFTTMVMRDNDIQQNICGVTVSAFGANASTPTTTDCGAATAASGINKPAQANMSRDGVNLHLGSPGAGVFSRGANARVELAYTDITNNSVGLRRVDGGLIQGTTPGTNQISNNGSNDGTSGSQTLARRR